MTDVSTQLNRALAGRYTIEREIGHGGMATVYLARDLRHGRAVAVKVLRPDLAVQLGAERFLREIGIAANLQHPHILTLIDSGADGDLLYYVMPFAEGESLRDRIAHGALPVSDATRYLRDVVDALAYAHAHGIVHRDIKPDNVIISGRHAVVVDFGVAKALAASKRSETGEPNATLTQLGTSIGTPAYMAPEQAAGDPNVDHRADIYAAGIVAYEMLAGRPPFEGAPSQVLNAQISATPAPLSAVAPNTPPAFAGIIMRCIEKDPAQRYQTADELLHAVESLSTPEALASASVGAVRVSRRFLWVAGVAALAVIAVVAFAGVSRMREQRWARNVALPELQRLVESAQTDSAFAVADRAEKFLGDDPTFRTLRSRVSTSVVIRTDPAGARVYRSRYGDSASWTLIGSTPTDSVRVPNAINRYRVVAPGYDTALVAFQGPPNVSFQPPSFTTVTLPLSRSGSTPVGMVLIPGGAVEVPMSGLANLAILKIGNYYIDKHEVSNSDYKKFVAAGGYSDPKYWPAGSPAPSTFVDRSSRPGPATWEVGDYPAGQGDLPVAGVSWYEAMAYAKFAGKHLPTVYHWSRAATPAAAGLVIPGSNYGGQGVMRPNTFSGMSPFGTFDMAGNVREWCVNATGDKRFVFGGGWSDPAYSFNDAYAQDPMNRAPINGIRLMLPVDAADAALAIAAAPIKHEFRDYTVERPATDAQFQGFRGFFDYDRTPLHAKLEYRDTTNADWIRERVSFDAAYGGERMAAVLFLPRRPGRQGRVQTVLLFPGSNYLYMRSDSTINVRGFDYHLKAGRALVLPVYKGMMERNIGITTDAPQPTNAYRELMVWMVKDARRTLDYLATRPDIDMDRVAYFGYSFGGRVSPPLLANEPRFKAAILAVTGLKMERARPEVDPFNFLPRVKLPVLMLNGKYDFYFPVEISQQPFFNTLGTPKEHKRWIVFPEAHTVPRTEMVRESLAWLDKYLGPVK